MMHEAEMNTTDYAATTADLLAEQRRAMLERAVITVEPVALTAGDDRISMFEVRQNGQMCGWFEDDDAAYKFAYELAGEQE